LLGLSLVTGARTQTAPAVLTPPAEALSALVARVRDKLQTGTRTAAGLAPELADFETLLTRFHDQKSEDVARILYMEATLYGEVIGDSDKMKSLFARLKTEFPNTMAAGAAEQALTAIERSAKAAQASASLVGKPAPELHFMWSTRDGLKALSDLRGKVVVLDFWATWCGPCVASFPNIRELAEHYKGMDVVVVGVTSIQGSVTGLVPPKIDTRGDPKKELALMADYVKAKDMTWTVACSAEEVFNPDYGIDGIPHMAIIAPDGTVRERGMHPGATSLDEKVEKIDALLREFKLPTVAAKGK
jgi:thiol-disulfide isomerase/thioredoxin